VSPDVTKNVAVQLMGAFHAGVTFLFTLPTDAGELRT